MNKHILAAVGLIAGCFLLVSSLQAEIVTLKDGRVIVAKKVIKSGGKVFVITDKGKETFDEDQIASIVEGDKAPAATPAAGKPPASAPAATPATPPKESTGTTGAGGKETMVENLETLYKLGKYEDLLAAAGRTVPPAAKIKVKLLVAKANCRAGKFGEAEKLYQELSSQGTTGDKVYAKACADILKANPDGAYKGAAALNAAELMKGNEAKTAKNSPASQPAEGSLKDEKIFDSALRAYAMQYLKDGEPLVTKLKAAWKPEQTAGDFERSGSGKITVHYEAERKKLIGLYDSADAISPGISASVRKELVRQEAEHIESVLVVLADKVDELDPKHKSYKAYVDNNKMTTTAQNQWKAQTDKAVAAAKIALTAAAYLVGLYKQNEADFGAKIKEAEARKSQIEGQITGLLKDRDRKFLE